MTLWQRIAGLAATFSDCKPGVDIAALAVPDTDGRNSVAFTMAVIALGAKMAKADGVVLPVEVEAFHQVFKTPADERSNVDHVFAISQGDIAGYETYADQVRALLRGDQQLLRGVLESLFHIASADRALHPGEDTFLANVATRFGLSASTYRHIRAQFVDDASGPYDVLGLDPAVPDDVVRARYRKLVRENHPDVLTGRGLPPEMIDVANRKLAAINAAYAALARERGL